MPHCTQISLDSVPLGIAAALTALGHDHGVFPATCWISCVLEACSSCSEGQSSSSCCSPDPQEL